MLDYFSKLSRNFFWRRTFLWSCGWSRSLTTELCCRSASAPCCASSVRIQLLLCPQQPPTVQHQPAILITSPSSSSHSQPQLQLVKLDKMFRPRTQEFVQEHTFYMWINMWTWAYAWTTQTTKYSKANIYFTDWHRLKNLKSLPYNYPKALL